MLSDSAVSYELEMGPEALQVRYSAGDRKALSSITAQGRLGEGEGTAMLPGHSYMVLAAELEGCFFMKCMPTSLTPLFLM